VTTAVDDTPNSSHADGAEVGLGREGAEAAAESPRAASKAVWHDSDDDEIEVDIAAGPNRLRKLAKVDDVKQDEGEGAVLNTRLTGKEYEKRLRERVGTAQVSWAAQLRDQQERDVTEMGRLKQQVGGLLDPKSARTRIPSGQLEVTKLTDANKASPSQSVVTSTEFHPDGRLMMTASLDRRVRFFGVDGIKNPHIQSIMFEDMPVTKAQFVDTGSKVLCAGRRKFFYSLDLETSKMEKVAKIFGRQERSFESFIANDQSDTVAFIGQDGSLPLVSVKSRQLVGTLKMSGSVRAGAFNDDGTYLCTNGGDGIVHVWDMRQTRACVRAFRDEGSLGATSMAVRGGLLASGSKSGIVNVYKDVWRTSSAGMASTQGLIETVVPHKALSHLTTTADTLTFSADGQLLATASRMKRDAMRLIHVESMTAFSNWPTSKSPLHYVHSVAISPSGGFLCIGNARGRAVMYRLHHFNV
jgi:U3 small nucleolar RNA-associated protein 18